MPTAQKAKILGIWIGINASEEDTYEWNYKHQINKIQGICNSWAHRNLSIKGKITIANALLISLLQFPSSVTYTPPRVIKEYKTISREFVWSGKRPKVLHESIIQTIPNGGLKLLDLEVRKEVNMLQWIKRLILKPHMNAGNTLGHITESDSVVRYLSYRNPSFPEHRTGFRFYRDMMTVWRKYRCFEPVGESAIRKEHFWFNDRLSTTNTHLNWKKWEQRGIVTIGDLCHESEDRLLSHTEISDKCSTNCSFLEALSMRASIPVAWKRSLTANWQHEQASSSIDIKLNEDTLKDITTLSAKRMYENIIVPKERRNAARERWFKGEEDVKVTSQEEWSSVCTRVYTCTRETKIQSFQFKLLHGITPCGTYLKRLRINTTDQCSLCGQKDSIVHFFYGCRVVKTFWSRVGEWLAGIEDIQLDQLTPKDYLFGTPREARQSRITNRILLYARYYIHRQRLFYSGELDLLQWLQEFRDTLRIEQWICEKMGRKRHFDKWLRILRALG